MPSNVRNDRIALQRTMEAIISESRKTRQNQLPGLEQASPPVLGQNYSAKVLPERIAELVYDIPAKRRLNDLVLQPQIIIEVEEFIHEFSNAALLRENSLEPRHTLLLIGPPGNGKTSLAEAFATELGLPLLSIRYDAIIDSFLGETSNRLRRLIDYASLNPCILFFDEFDAVGKERSDAQETGEIKRVVSSLLMQLDRLPSHTLVICATNHPELLDRAVWRRFELKLEINRPDRNQLKAWFSRFAASLNLKAAGIDAETFANHMVGKNMSEVEAFTLDVRRKMILSKGKITAADAVQHVLERLNKSFYKIDQTVREYGERLSNSSIETGSNHRPAKKRKKATISGKDFLPNTD